MGSRRLCSTLAERAPFAGCRGVRSGGLDSKVVFSGWRLAGRREGNAMGSRLWRFGRFDGCEVGLRRRSQRRRF